MPASTDPAQRSFRRRGALIALAVVMLGALAIGLWPGAVNPRRSDFPIVTLPVLQCAAVALTAFGLLIWPVIVLADCRKGRSPSARALAGDGATFLAVASPVIVLGAMFADATATDSVRTVLYLVALWPMAAGAGLALSKPALRTMALLGMLIVTLALPAAQYVVEEWIASPVSAPARLLGHLGPLTAVWQVADARQASLLPEPVWPAIVWLAVGMLGWLTALIIKQTGIARDTTSRC